MANIPLERAAPLRTPSFAGLASVAGWVALAALAIGIALPAAFLTAEAVPMFGA